MYDAKHSAAIAPRHPAVLNQARILGEWNDRVWHAVARIRYCHAYCATRDSEQMLTHLPACAYATARWMDVLRRDIRAEMLSA